MNKLLAPNGKPSNLTPEQYKLVRTPAFKDWFGDWENSPETSSKVVDSNGEPLVCYHGTYLYKGYYTEFNSISYFTDNKITAENYPVDSYVFYETFDEYADDYGLDESDIDTLKKYDYDVDKLKSGNIMVREDDWSAIWKDYDPAKLFVYECFLNLRNPQIIENADDFDITWITVSNDKRVENAKFENYDSIIGIYPYKWFSQDKINYHRGIIGDFEKEKHFVTFNSSQIKLADGTNTTFDGSNPDIRYDGGGKIMREESYKKIGNFFDWFEENGWQELNEKEIENIGLDYYATGVVYKSPDKNISFGFSQSARLVLNNGLVKKIILKYDKLPVIILDSLIVKEKGKGHGTKAIKLLTELADKFGVEIQVQPSPLIDVEQYLDKNQLIKFYKNAGFQSIDGQNNYEILIYNSKQLTKDTENKYADGGLIAPNGKPSNLTPEQYKLVRTPEFKEWFGDWQNDPANASKVVDENGEPKVMYHSSDSEFTIFNPEHKSRWINQRKEKAIWFGGNNKVSSYTNNGYLYEVFLYCFNPIIVDAKDYDSWNYYYDENNNKTYDIGRIKGRFVTQAKEVKWDGTANNNDGVLFFNAWDNVPLGIVCVVFEPNQIKLADGTNTTFDGSNPDIRFDEGGSVNDKKQQLNKDMEYKNYAKGGKILGNVTPQGFNHQEQQKYARIGVTDKYQIQAYIDMSIQGVNFDSVSLNNKLKKSLEELYATYEDYLISEDSRGIDTFFLAQIRQAENQGQPAEMIEQIRINQTNPESRKQKINEVAEGQKLTLLTWIDYLKQSDYSTEFCYLLFNAILNFNYVLAKNDVVKRTKTTTEGFTPFSASVLAKLYDAKSNYLLKDYIELLSKEADNLVNEVVTNEQDGGIWLTFLGKGNANDVEIKENAEKLSALVQRTQWCTTSRAESQLAGGGGYKGGNFYVFATNTDAGLEPQIAIRMDLDEVGEISGRLDGQYMSPEYSEIAIRFCRENIPNNSGEKYIKMLQYNSRVGNSIKRLNEEGMYPEILSDYAYVVKNQNEANSRYGNNPNTKMFFDSVSTAISNLPNQYFEANEFSDSVSNLTPTTKYFLGDLTLSQYNNYDLGTSSLVEILGQLNIENNSTSFGQLQKIGGDLIISSPTIQSFDSIEYIGGQIKFTGTNLGLTSFGNLTEYGGTINCITQFTNLIDLGNLVECGDLIIGESSALETTGNLSVAKSILCSSSKNITFPNLVSVLENCDFNKSQTTDLPALQRVGGNFNINSSRLKVFPQLNFIGGNANFGNNFTSTTQNIGRILGDLHLVNSRLKEFTNLTYVKGNIDLKGSLIESLGSIERTDGNIDLSEPNKLKSLGKLEFIGGYFNASGGDIEDMGNVKQIIKFANFGSSKIQSLGNLESVGGSLFLKNSVVNNLGNLIFVGRKIEFGNRADLEAQWNQLTGRNENQNFAVGGAIESQKTGNNATLSISLLTRLLELSNEDLKNDLQIHKVVENISSMSNKTLTIDDYNSIINDVNKFSTGGQTEAQKEKVSTVMREFKEGKLKTSYGEKVTNPKQAIAIALSEAGIKRKDDGGVLEISAYEGNIPLSLPEHYYSADSDVELVPVVDLMKFREFDRKKTPKYNLENSNYIINNLKESFKNEGIKEPLIIEYSVDDNSVLLIEGNHRLNTAIDMGLMYLPARVVLRKNKFTPTSKKLSMQVDGMKPNEYGYIPSNLKPSQVGLSQAKKMFVEGGIIEGQLHSECNDETGCGVKFEVGEGGHIIEAERDEAVIVPEAFEINETMTITGTPSQIASALNVLGGGKNFDSGANIESKSFSGKTEQLKPMAKNTDVDYTIGNASIIINRRTMADTGIYKAVGTPKQIASAINSMNGNGVEIGEVGKLEKIK